MILEYLQREHLDKCPEKQVNWSNWTCSLGLVSFWDVAIIYSQSNSLLYHAYFLPCRKQKGSTMPKTAGYLYVPLLRR